METGFEKIIGLLKQMVVTGGTGATLVKSSALENSHILKVGAGNLVSLTVTNTNAASQFFQLFDSATVPADNTVPLVSPKLAARDSRSYNDPISFTNGLVVCNSTTVNNKTIGSNDCTFCAMVR